MNREIEAAMRRHPAGRALVPDYLTRVYVKPDGLEQVAHLVFSTSDPAALCGAESELFTGWFGTGSQDEYEAAEELDLCAGCKREAGVR